MSDSALTYRTGCSGWEGRTFNRDELQGNARAVADWNRFFEVPDVVGFADYAADAPRIAAALSTQSSAQFEPGPLTHFPFPNPPKPTLRQLAVAGFHAHLFLRTAAGHIVRTTDRLLSPCVRSCRLAADQGGAWRFQDVSPAHRAFREKAVDHLRWSTDAMGRTDVESYYPSISVGVLNDELHRWRCDMAAVAPMLRVIGLWQARGEVAGIPIGPDASRVLGNALLKTVDDAIAAANRTHLRWMDDILFFGETIPACEDMIGPMDGAFAALGLRRSAPKTRFFDNADAIQEVNDRMLASLSNRIQRPRGKEHLHDAFDIYVLGADHPETHHFRWILRTMESKRDAYAAVALVDRPATMNTDPRQSASYIAAVGLGKDRVHESVMRRLAEPPEDTFDGLDLHLLRAESMGRRRGKAEGRAFLSIAENRQRRSPVRAWAYTAASRTSGWNEGLAMAAADAETDPLVRRSVVLTLRGKRTKRVSDFLSHMVSKFLDLESTRRWVDAA